ncbi:MAG: hypothetical protein KBD16_03010 [Candidatus Pacebacteria bacterium]|nr:hypothetical protein [Candidatus Paceibacterota bacterium]
MKIKSTLAVSLLLAGIFAVGCAKEPVQRVSVTPSSEEQQPQPPTAAFGDISTPEEYEQALLLRKEVELSLAEYDRRIASNNVFITMRTRALARKRVAFWLLLPTLLAGGVLVARQLRRSWEHPERGSWRALTPSRV